MEQERKRFRVTLLQLFECTAWLAAGLGFAVGVVDYFRNPRAWSSEELKEVCDVCVILLTFIAPFAVLGGAVGSVLGKRVRCITIALGAEVTLIIVIALVLRMFII